MAKIIKNTLGNFLVICLIFLTVMLWVFAGWPQIFNFPPKIQEAQAATYILKSTDSDLPVGADFNKEISTGTQTASSITVTVLAAETDTSYAYTVADVPNNAVWETGGITVEVNVTVAQVKMFLSVSASRVDSLGVLQETSEATAEQNLGAVLVYTFNIPSKDWADGECGDRLRINYHFRNDFTKTKDVTIGTGTTDTDHTTSISENAGACGPSLSITAPENVQMPDYQLGGDGYSEVNFSDVVQVTADAGFTVTVSSTNLTGGGNTILASDVKLRTDGNIENNPTRIPSASCSGFTPTEPAANEYALDTAKNVVTATLDAGGTCDIYPTIKVYISNNLLAAQVTGTLTFTVF